MAYRSTVEFIAALEKAEELVRVPFPVATELEITAWADREGKLLGVECEATVAALTSLIEPMLIVFLGVVVGGIVMAMFLPIFQLGAVAGGLQ